MKVVRVLVTSIDYINKKIGEAVSWLVIIILALTVIEVVLRRLLNAPTIWSAETASFIFGAYFMLLAGYVLLHKRHVAVDIIYNCYSPRGKTIFDIVCFLLLFLVWVGLALQGAIGAAASSWELRQASHTAFGPPLYPLKTALAVALVLLLIQGLAEFIRKIVFLVKGREL